MRAFLAAVAVLAAGALPAAAQAPSVRAFEAVYSVHARGMEAGQATYTFSFNGSAYRGASERRMTGLARAMLGSSQDYTYAVTGQIGPGWVLQPESYRHQGGRRGRVVQAAFSPDDIVTTANPEMGMGNPPATPAQKRGAIDQVSMFAQMLFAQGDPCRQSLKIYLDGRSRFDFAMSPDGRQDVNIGGFRGSAYRCSVAYRPIAGFGDPQEPATLTFLFGEQNGVFLPLRIEMPSDDAGVIRLQMRSFTLR